MVSNLHQNGQENKISRFLCTWRFRSTVLHDHFAFSLVLTSQTSPFLSFLLVIYFSLRKQKQTEGNFRLLHIIHSPLIHCPHYACLSLQLILGPKSRVACIPDAVSSPRLLSCFSQLYWYAWEMPLSPTWKESVTLSSFRLAPELSVCYSLYIFFFGVVNNSSFTSLNSAY